MPAPTREILSATLGMVGSTPSRQLRKLGIKVMNVKGVRGRKSRRR